MEGGIRKKDKVKGKSRQKPLLHPGVVGSSSDLISNYRSVGLLVNYMGNTYRGNMFYAGLRYREP